MITTIGSTTNRYGRPPTPWTLHPIRATLRSALNAAIREGLLRDNPSRYIEVPSPRRPHALVWTAQRVEAWQQTGERPSVAVWTTEQTATFLSFVAQDRLAVMWWLIALLGLRRGEAAGLRWADLELDAGVAMIEQQRIANGHLVTVGPPKTAAGRRENLAQPPVRARRSERDDVDTDSTRRDAARYRGPYTVPMGGDPGPGLRLVPRSGHRTEPGGTAHFVVLNYIDAYLQHLGAPTQLTSVALVIMGGGSIIGTLLVGRVSSRSVSAALLLAPITLAAGFAVLYAAGTDLVVALGGVALWGSDCLLPSWSTSKRSC